MSHGILSRKLAALLAEQNIRIVFAESCTGGLIAGTLSQIPGISQYLCGGMVAYRDEIKHAWLRIPDKVLIDPGAVSDVVAHLMAERVLKLTPDAQLALSVTGHLGPDAPPQLDGVVFIGLALRERRTISTAVQRFVYPGRFNRVQRQRRAIADALRTAIEFLKSRTTANHEGQV